MGGRLITSRTAENNKNVTIKYSNRLSTEPISTPYGEQFEYGEIEELDVCLVPFQSQYEASAYGVNMVGSFKISLTLEDSKKFNEFTHIWLDTSFSDRDEPEYIVKQKPTTLNYGLLVITKKIGKDV